MATAGVLSPFPCRDSDKRHRGGGEERVTSTKAQQGFPIAPGISCRHTVSIQPASHPSIHPYSAVYPCLCCSGSRLSKVVHILLSPFTSSSSPWGISRPDGIYNLFSIYRVNYYYYCYPPQLVTFNSFLMEHQLYSFLLSEFLILSPCRGNSIHPTVSPNSFFQSLPEAHDHSLECFFKLVTSQLSSFFTSQQQRT